jgi:hypothetical protein
VRNKILGFICIAVIALLHFGYSMSAQDRFPGTRPPAKSNCVTAFDCQEGISKVGDRVIYFTDADADGFFEKNVALVADDVNAVGRLNGTGVEVGHKVNLWVFPAEDATKGHGIRNPYFVENATRGRSLGEYEALANANN